MSEIKSPGEVMADTFQRFFPGDIFLPWAFMKTEMRNVWEILARDAFHELQKTAANADAAAAPLKEVNEYIDIAPQKVYLNKMAEDDGRYVLQVTSQVPTAQRHHKTPGSTAAIVDSINKKLGEKGMMLRCSIIHNAEALSELSRLDPETGDVRELLDYEGTW